MMSYVCGHKNEISLPLQPIDNDRRDHYNGKVPQPITTDSNSSAFRASFQGKDLWNINPWHTIDTRAEDQHVSEEEGNRGGGGRFGH